MMGFRYLHNLFIVNATKWLNTQIMQLVWSQQPLKPMQWTLEGAFSPSPFVRSFQTKLLSICIIGPFIETHLLMPKKNIILSCFEYWKKTPVVIYCKSC